MKNLCLALVFVLGSLASAQDAGAAGKNHIVDFDQDFFNRNPYSKWMRDPFKNPPGVYSGAVGVSAWPKLDSITHRKDKAPIAILDGKKYREGEFIDEKRFVSTIGTNYVILSEGSYDYELVMKLDQKALSAYNADRAPASTEDKR